MITVRTVPALRAAVAAARRQGKQIGFVPTMGFLHEGHLSLVDAARGEGATFVVVSIFVNPRQFGPHEDFERYPRDEERDAALLAGRGVDVLFAPSVAEMYPPESEGGSRTRIQMEGVALPLEGERRPGHFEGVATVVLKLLNMVQPDVAVFGQKDAQQCAVVAQMVRDLDVPVRLLFAPTVREQDGLAMSSRNAYLRDEERTLALALSASLRAGERQVRAGAVRVAVEASMKNELAKFDGVQLDYLALVDRFTFLPPAGDANDLLLVGAVKVGKTRLIDNIIIASD